MLVSFVFLNLFVAVILEGFSEISEQDAEEKSRSAEGDDDHPELIQEEYEEFCRTWSTYDPRMTMSLGRDQVAALMAELPEPMGLGLARPWPPLTELVALVESEVPELGINGGPGE